ncbi:MAG: haloacid dehalogenase [Microbacterium sp.]|uniref:HAD-IIA family hydrolase n=1 Tax=Microbacterium sp. UBA3394 TaxID=1946945 RepID=UPI000C552AC7|nr:HAD-IIA family hydrolase [Microbacterium sp. UBA3394]MAM53345.1 haloacid dehalogenase [Microbacterium sp.]
MRRNVRHLHRPEAWGASDACPLDGADALFADLDGVVYRGSRSIPHAVESLARVRVQMPMAFLTNNASRTPAEVASHLRRLGVHAGEADIISSPQVVVELLRTRVPPGAPVLVVGGLGLAMAVSVAGYSVVRTAADSPDAVVQGFDPTVSWRDLAEACYVLGAADHGRVPWIAANSDLALPLEQGKAPGNGALVQAVQAAVGGEPIYAGKPGRAMFDTALALTGARSPLFVGDRLDTDIAGARAVGIRTALVLTGVTTEDDLRGAPPQWRPDVVLQDLRGLFEPSVPA